MVTITGWFAMALGLFRMFAPEMQLNAVKNINLVIVEATIVLAFGIFITIKSYGRKM